MILLDTNALLWAASAEQRLGPQAVNAIRGADRVHYSAVSVMEISIKHMLGRVALPGGDRFPAVFDEMGLAELPFTAKHANAMRDEERIVRHDPFDRMILAQASVERMMLLTADATLRTLGWAGILDARA